jgi:hypothetical protein
MALMRIFFLTLILNFNVIALLLFFYTIVIVTSNEHAYVMHYMGVMRPNFFPRNIVLG